MSDKIIVFASFTPKAGAEATVEGILQAMVAPSRNEPGCAALDHHRSTEHYKNYRAVIAENLAEDIAVKVLSGINVAD
jgi:quinol monooxygenase YgiN